jgi:hypothetical protein
LTSLWICFFVMNSKLFWLILYISLIFSALLCYYILYFLLLEFVFALLPHTFSSSYTLFSSFLLFV